MRIPTELINQVRSIADRIADEIIDEHIDEIEDEAMNLVDPDIEDAMLMASAVEDEIRRRIIIRLKSKF